MFNKFDKLFICCVLKGFSLSAHVAFPREIERETVWPAEFWSTHWHLY